MDDLPHLLLGRADRAEDPEDHGLVSSVGLPPRVTAPSPALPRKLPFDSASVQPELPPPRPLPSRRPSCLPASTATSSRSWSRRTAAWGPCSSCSSRARSCRRWALAQPQCPAAPAPSARPPPSPPALALGPGGDGALPEPGAGPGAAAAAALAGADPQDEGRVPGPQPVQRERHAQVPHCRGLVRRERPARPAAGAAGQLGEWGWGGGSPALHFSQAGASSHLPTHFLFPTPGLGQGSPCLGESAPRTLGQALPVLMSEAQGGARAPGRLAQQALAPSREPRATHL